MSFVKADPTSTIYVVHHKKDIDPVWNGDLGDYLACKLRTIDIQKRGAWLKCSFLTFKQPMTWPQAKAAIGENAGYIYMQKFSIPETDNVEHINAEIAKAAYRALVYLKEMNLVAVKNPNLTKISAPAPSAGKVVPSFAEQLRTTTPPADEEW